MKRRQASVFVVALLLFTAACSTAAKGGTTRTTPDGGKPPGAIAITPANRPSGATVKACVAQQPATWMGCIVKADSAFGRFPISGLALPGSRNAGTYNLDPASFDTQQGSACTSYAGDTKVGAEFARWNETQDETITEQLNEGIRFVDLQVAYNGDGSATKGWRVVQSLYSEFPLYDYLDQVAIWARAHPTEFVVLDVSTICYDRPLNTTVEDGLWQNFDTPSDVQTDRTTIQKVAFDSETAGVPLSGATIDQVARPGHNVVVVVPANATGVSTPAAETVHPIVAGDANSANAPTSASHVAVVSAHPEISPTKASAFGVANTQLKEYPLGTTPALGTLLGKGLYVAQLAYSVTSVTRAFLFAHFGGLIVPVSTGPSPASHLPAWEANLWEGSAPRNQILAGWGHRVNIVLSDGVQYGGFVQAVIGLNAA